MHYPLNPFDWYEQQKKQKDEAFENGQVSILNRQLQQILAQFKDFIDETKYRAEINKANRVLSHCSIWNLCYNNNFENKEVAVEQALLILTILKKEEEVLQKGYLQTEVERIMKQIGNFDWSLYLEFNRRKKYLNSHFSS